MQRFRYRRSLRTLNESVLRWIDDHIKTNPYCILTPVFKDYEKYIKELDRDFPQSSDRVVGEFHFMKCTCLINHKVYHTMCRFSLNVFMWCLHIGLAINILLPHKG